MNLAPDDGWEWFPPDGTSPTERNMSPAQKWNGMMSIRNHSGKLFTIFLETEHLLVYTINWDNPQKGKLFAYVHWTMLR